MGPPAASREPPVPAVPSTRPSARPSSRPRESGSVRSGTQPGPARAAGEVVRWAALGCALVPVVPAVSGSSPGGAAAAAVALTAVTGACRRLLARRLPDD
ncbi:hypothetical protein C6N75_17575 [Streptomyces solincola]|uniref:Uncharacterized protein n=1 Tax=Streptomyces solincola TaxID=2100817 RepID=A0A2S9PUC1_9ACTN|nr:hypothetical protein C6N75_17575 [Streptomyces solincola]